MTRWASCPETTTVPEEPTYFDMEVTRLGLSGAPMAELRASQGLRHFAERERFRRYVPEALLRAWKLELYEVDINLC
jgi:hypothetical protein